MPTVNLLLLSAMLVAPAEAKNCPNSQPCGNSCISWSKTCHVGSGRSTYTPPAPNPKPSPKANAYEPPAKSVFADPDDEPQTQAQVDPAAPPQAAPAPEAAAIDPTPTAPQKKAKKSVNKQSTEPEVTVAPPLPVTEAVATPTFAVATPPTEAERRTTRMVAFGGLYTLLLLVGIAGTFSVKSEA